MNNPESNAAIAKTTHFLTISGGVSTGKSPIASILEETASKNGLTVLVCDHHLFSFQKSFDKELAKTKAGISKTGADLGIIVIGTGNNQQLNIDFGGNYFPIRKIFALFSQAQLTN